MFPKEITTVEQGSIGLGRAIAHFTSMNHTVSLPLNDNQDYDLIIDDNCGLKKVQVKTTRYKQNKSNYVVQLKSVRPNKTKNKIKNFDASNNDFLFILTENNEEYLIPSKVVNGKSAITLGEKVNKWKLKK